MELIRKLGKRLNKKGNSYELWGVFLCPIDNKEVEKPLSNGRRSKSCGCLGKGYNNIKHGGKGTRLYNIYQSIIGRCFTFSNTSYKNYGGRGITVCDEWLDKEMGFINFKDWVLSNGYAKGLQINRIFNDGNYEPSNCNFKTAKENSRNRRGQKIKNIEIANEIRDLYSTGNYTQKELAIKYNVGHVQIFRIVHNERWV